MLGRGHFILWFWQFITEGYQGRNLKAGMEAEQWTDATYGLALLWDLKNKTKHVFIVYRGEKAAGSLLIMSSWNQTQVFMLGGKYLYLLSHLARLKPGL